MKIRERSAPGTGGGRPSAPAPMMGGPTGERLPVAPRERKPALAALAVLLILVGALGATVLVMRAGNRISAIEVTQTVPAGEAIPASAIREVMVADGSDIKYVDWAAKDDLRNYRAATDLVGGTVLVKQMLSSADSQLKAGTAVIGLSLKRGQFPDGLRVGDAVAVYRVGSDAAKSANSATGSGTTLLTSKAKVKAVPGGGGDGISSGDSAYSIIVDQSDAGPLTLAASAGEVSLVLVPANKG
ncbi:hypothetical protein QMK19_22390 [Streptomyces sp. H10-C2]|uniref:hypothetical protein n=1 Tax=unclassified Streptomyces TaxID=2593676 RepID=UPI0024B8BEF6|nr:MULTISPECIES: hypothetical protein [unclassified Streptomyces]MDJ0342486.1 hypothetical protein [Streptomyces sp. PH10-H1]MDJ0372341.1 hypothetical protein [Streptomyces sp. H10-C2]